MRAAQVSEYGQELRVSEVPRPNPGPGEVLVRVHACGVNFADLLMRSGRYQERPPLPFTPGMELCGTVEASGPDVTHAIVGRRIMAYCGHGAMAEFAALPANACVEVPEGMSNVAAATFPIAYGTSHLALDHRARLQPGERLLVLGAAGGVGLTAVEIGKIMGAEVIACARGGARLAAAKAAGADHVVDSETGDIRASVKSLGGADVVVDPVGGEQFTAALRSCRPGARLVPLGFASGDIPRIPANILLVKNLTVIGLYWGAYASLGPSIMSASLEGLLAWHAEGRLTPRICRSFPLEEADAALEMLRSRKAVGKVVVTID